MTELSNIKQVRTSTSKFSKVAFYQAVCDEMDVSLAHAYKQFRKPNVKFLQDFTNIAIEKIVPIIDYSYQSKAIKTLAKLNDVPFDYLRNLFDEVSKEDTEIANDTNLTKESDKSNLFDFLAYFLFVPIVLFLVWVVYYIMVD